MRVHQINQVTRGQLSAMRGIAQREAIQNCGKCMGISSMRLRR
jgi:hypothetical protein